MAQYHVFKFSEEGSHAVLVKGMTSTSSWIRFLLLTRNVTPQDAHLFTVNRFETAEFKTVTKPQIYVPYSNEWNRKAYLMNKTLDWYYVNDLLLRSGFSDSRIYWT